MPESFEDPAGECDAERAPAVLETPEGPIVESVEQGRELSWDDGYMRPLDPARIAAERWSAVLIVLGLLLLYSGAMLSMWIFGEVGHALMLGLLLGGGLLIVLIAVLLFIWPVLENRRTRWRLDSEGIEIQRGVVWRHLISVPRRRIQHTDVAQGPLQRRFGLGTLVMHTAGTHSFEIRLEGIAHSTALQVRDLLIEGSRSASSQEAVDSGPWKAEASGELNDS